MASPPIIAELAKWIVAFDYGGVPQNVLARAKLSLLDALGTAFAAATYSQAAANALSVLDKLGQSGSCAVIGARRRASVVDATFGNALLIRALDFNDYLPRDPNDGARLGSHPSDTMAVGLAVGEDQNSSGLDFLSSMVMGYELNGRLLKLFGSGSYWDSTTVTSLVSPAIAGRLMRLDEERLASALAFGAAHGVTHKAVRRGHISAAKFLADAIVARHGVFSTLLAANGVPGPIGVFEGPLGLGDAVYTKGNLPDLLRPLGKRYIFEGVCIKAYPSFANSQAAISAAMQVRKDFKGSADDIQKITLRVADVPEITSQLKDGSRRSPTNRETADHSFHFAVAAALIDGELTLQSFENDRWEDPAIRRLIDKIEIIPDGGWNTRPNGGAPASVEIMTNDGQLYSADVAYQFGHVQNPMGMESIVAKFQSNTEGVVDPERGCSIIETVMQLEKQKSLKALTALLGDGSKVNR